MRHLPAMRSTRSNSATSASRYSITRRGDRRGDSAARSHSSDPGLRGGASKTECLRRPQPSGYLAGGPATPLPRAPFDGSSRRSWASARLRPARFSSTRPRGPIGLGWHQDSVIAVRSASTFLDSSRGGRRRESGRCSRPPRSCREWSPSVFTWTNAVRTMVRCASCPVLTGTAGPTIRFHRGKARRLRGRLSRRRWRRNDNVPDDSARLVEGGGSLSSPRDPHRVCQRDLPAGLEWHDRISGPVERTENSGRSRQSTSTVGH